MANKDTGKIKPWKSSTGKTEKQMVQEAQKKSAVKGAAKGAGAGAASKLVQDITNRYRVTAREARDIVTAVSTAADLRGASKVSKQQAMKNVGKQITETAKTAVTGKPGTRSGQTIKAGDIKVVKRYGTPSEVKKYK